MPDQGECMIERSVCGVVVTFRPRSEDLAELRQATPPGARVGGCGQRFSGGNAEAILRTASRACDFTLIENGDNLGIATALNIGVKWAQSEGYALGRAVRSGQHRPAHVYRHHASRLRYEPPARPDSTSCPSIHRQQAGYSSLCGLRARWQPAGGHDIGQPDAHFDCQSRRMVRGLAFYRRGRLRILSPPAK